MTHQADWRSLRTPGLANVSERILRAIEHPTFDESPGNGRRRDGIPPPRHLPPLPVFPALPAFPPLPAIPTFRAIRAIPTFRAFPAIPTLHP